MKPATSDRRVTAVKAKAEGCAGCAWWSPEPGAAESPLDLMRRLGECRRNPPTPLESAHSDGILSEWPITRADNWCGEWREAK